MRHGMGVLGLVVLLAGAGSAAAPAAQAVPNLVAYWKLDEGTGTSALDSSGNGHLGVLQAGAAFSTTLFPAMPPNNAGSVGIVNATSNQRVAVANAAGLNVTTAFTLACWVRPSGTPDTQMGLIEKWSGGGSAINGYILRLGKVNSPATGHHVKAAVGNGTTQIEAGQYGQALPTNVWTHVAATYDGTTLRVYRNGTQVATAAAPAGSVTPSTDPLHLGQDYGANRLQGNLDEAYVFNDALTAAEIGILVNGQPPPGGPLTVTPLVDQLDLSWNAGPNAVSYNIYRSDNGGAFTLIRNQTGTTYLDTTATYPGTYAYQITAVGFMESAPLGPVSGTPFSPIPRTNDHEEGLIDDNCACGSSIPAGPIPWAGLLALLGVALRRRSA